jgi:membrane fusion protein, heavy metal efflux system
MSGPFMAERSTTQIRSIEHVRRRNWAFMAVLLLAIALTWLIAAKTTYHPLTEQPAATSPAVDPITILGPGLIRVDSNSSFWKNFAIADVKQELTRRPLFIVSCSVVARLQRGDAPVANRWMFESDRLTKSYAEWIRSGDEVQSALNQQSETQNLVDATNKYLTEEVNRLQPLNMDASIPDAEFRKARIEEKKGQLQGNMDMFTVNSRVQTAQNNRATVERELLQAGINPDAFAKPKEDSVLVVADVPESDLAQVRPGQLCNLRFDAFATRHFETPVKSFSPLVSQQRRTLHVLFERTSLVDCSLEAGMSGEAEFGIEPRNVTLLTAESVLNVDDADYVLVEAGHDTWRVQSIKCGDFYDDKAEVVSGLAPEVKVISRGAFLLMPAVVKSLSQHRPDPVP